MAAKVSLANKEIEVESSNAGYYIAAASILSAISVSICVMRKNKSD